MGSWGKSKIFNVCQEAPAFVTMWLLVFFWASTPATILGDFSPFNPLAASMGTIPPASSLCSLTTHLNPTSAIHPHAHPSSLSITSNCMSSENLPLRHHGPVTSAPTQPHWFPILLHSHKPRLVCSVASLISNTHLKHTIWLL